MNSDKVLIGRVRYENVDAAHARLGLTVAPVPADEYDRVMVDHINATGGLGGRKLELVYYTVDAADPNSTQAGLDQQACELWTRDKPVFTVLSGASEQLTTCLHKANVSNIYENVFSSSDDAAFRRFPLSFEINAISLTRLGKVQVDGLFEQGYFGSKPTIGVVTWDGPEFRNTIARVTKPALRAHGLALHPDGEAYIKIPQSQAEQGDSAAAIQAAVLRFNAAGIDHVMIIGDSGAGLVIFFTRSAQSQDYHPRYGLTSENAPAVAIDQGAVDPQQFRGARVVGWNPIGDIGNRKHALHGPGYDSCIKLLESKGVDFGNDDNARVVGIKTCDGFLFLQRAVRAGLPSITTASLVAGSEGVGRDHPAALTYGAQFGPTRHFGVGVVAYSAFHEDCNCFRYVGGLRSIS